ncbi:MAG: Mur ligase family protein [Candidatus Levybacteria bacterium]|nr:Mur ligase family protein [Candidatus Levybacteria bacterium]
MNSILILAGKLLSIISRFLNVGSGSTWPGHIALNLNKNFIKDLLKKSKIKIILIAGTNGKTTTGKLIKEILEKNGKKVFINQTGANLLNGIASSMLLRSSILCKINYDFAIFEIDENTLPLILKEISNPDFILILNLFRDQLDRYGEVNTIATKWKEVLSKLSPKTKLILNADDPQVAYLGLSRGVVSDTHRVWNRSYTSVFYFGLENKKRTNKNLQHASDSTYCPNCGSKLSYSMIFYSHLGVWGCPNCKNARPKLDEGDAPIYPLLGIYNRYNTIAAVLLSRQLNIEEKNIIAGLKSFKPAFGRQERINTSGKKVQIFLSKNPTSFNESLRTVSNLGAKNLLIVLNDRIPDGRDVSWIWDVDFEVYIKSFKNITVSGDRAYDMGLRIKYTQTIIHDSLFIIQEDLKKAIELTLEKTPKSEILYILPTYSAMLEVRKILTGKKIL